MTLWRIESADLAFYFIDTYFFWIGYLIKHRSHWIDKKVHKALRYYCFCFPVLRVQVYVVICSTNSNWYYY